MAKKVKGATVLAVIAGGSAVAVGLYWLNTRLKYGSSAELLTTGNPAYDRYDAVIASAVDRLGAESIALGRVIKSIAWHESQGYRFAQQVHPDGLSWGLMGLNSRYFAGDLSNPQRNAVLGAAHFLKLWKASGENLDLALNRYHYGPSGTQNQPYAANVRNEMVRLWSPARSLGLASEGITLTQTVYRMYVPTKGGPGDPRTGRVGRARRAPRRGWMVRRLRGG